MLSLHFYLTLTLLTNTSSSSFVTEGGLVKGPSTVAWKPVHENVLEIITNPNTSSSSSTAAVIDGLDALSVTSHLVHDADSSHEEWHTKAIAYQQRIKELEEQIRVLRL